MARVREGVAAHEAGDAEGSRGHGWRHHVGGNRPRRHVLGARSPPLVALTQIGITVALGVLLDTFVVRSILVPALTFSIDEKTWWPSRLGRR